MSYDIKDFAVEVVNRSFSIPVLVDFWAEWCAPCKMLGPVLERLAERANNRWALAKINTEEFPDIAQEYRISSIPAVKLFVDGNAIAEFVGALPEYQVEKWLEKVLPSKLQKQVDKAAELLSQHRIDEGRKLLEEVIKAEPDNQHAKILLATTLIFSEQEKAVLLVTDISDSKFIEVADALRVFAKLFHLYSQPDALPDKPIKQQYLMAIADLHSKKFDKALEEFIDIIHNDRYYDDDGSRKACIAIFKFLGEENEITIKHRRDFSNALY